jgi:hypothetical protein
VYGTQSDGGAHRSKISSGVLDASGSLVADGTTGGNSVDWISGEGKEMITSSVVAVDVGEESNSAVAKDTGARVGVACLASNIASDAPPRTVNTTTTTSRIPDHTRPESLSS